MDLSVDLFFTHRPPGGGAVAQRAHARLDLAAFPGRDTGEPLAALERFAAENSVLPETEDQLAACLDALLRSDAEGGEGLWHRAGSRQEQSSGAGVPAAQGEIEAMLAAAASAGDDFRLYAAGDYMPHATEGSGNAREGAQEVFSSIFDKDGDGELSTDEASFPQAFLAMVAHHDLLCAQESEHGGQRQASLLDEFVALAHQSALSAREHAEDTRLRLDVLRHRQAVARAEAAAVVRRAEYRPSVHGMMDQEAARVAAAHCVALDALDALVNKQEEEMTAKMQEWQAEVAALAVAQADDLRAFVQQGVAKLLGGEGDKDGTHSGDELRDQLLRVKLSRGTRVDFLHHTSDSSGTDGPVVESALNAEVVSAMVSLLGNQTKREKKKDGKEKGEGLIVDDENGLASEGFHTPKRGRKQRTTHTEVEGIIRRSDEGQEEDNNQIGASSSKQDLGKEEADPQIVASIRSSGSGAAVGLTSLSPRASAEMATVKRRAMEASRYVRGAEGPNLIEHFVCFIGAQRRVPVHICVALCKGRAKGEAGRAFGSIANEKEQREEEAGVAKTKESKEEERQSEEEQKKEERALPLISDSAIALLQPFTPSMIDMCVYELQSAKEEAEEERIRTLDERRDTLRRLCVRAGGEGAGPWLGQRRQGGRGMRALLLPFATNANSQFAAVCSASADYLFRPTAMQIANSIKSGQEVRRDLQDAENVQMQPGDLLVTRHSNLRLTHAVFHAVVSPALSLSQNAGGDDNGRVEGEGGQERETGPVEGLADAVTNAVYTSTRHEVESLVLPLSATLGRYAPVSLVTQRVDGDKSDPPAITTSTALPASAIRRAEALLQAVKRGLELSVASEDGRVLGSVIVVVDEIMATLGRREYDRAAATAVSKVKEAVETTVGKGATGVLTREQSAGALASVHTRYRENVAAQMSSVVRAVFSAEPIDL